jgi:hypothetical protein
LSSGVTSQLNSLTAIATLGIPFRPEDNPETVEFGFSFTPEVDFAMIFAGVLEPIDDSVLA